MMDRESDVGSSETGSGRDTPHSVDTDSQRPYTPGTMPEYQYSKEELFKLRDAPASIVIPDCLDKEFMLDNVWDPERWVKSFGGGSSAGGSRGASPLTMPEPRERREIFRRNSGSEKCADPKERLKEDSKDGIILSPQRRSFGTGCHVAQQPLLQRAISNIESERDRRDTRRIGSGRIQIDRDRGTERDFRSERDRDRERERDRPEGPPDRDFRSVAERIPERDTRDFSSRADRLQERDRDPRDFRSTRDKERMGDRTDRDFRNPRDRYERDDRDRDRRFERDRMFVSRRDTDRRGERDFRDFGGRHNNRRMDRNDARQEEEPEWFSTGPITKNDTIELHGFERERARRDSDRAEDNGKKNVNREEEEEEKGEQSAIGVSDRNGSLETNESSSPEANHSDADIKQQKTSSPNFDFNMFFSFGINMPDETAMEADTSDLGGSRFYNLYRPANQRSGGSKDNSRRSSLIEEDFGFLNDLVNGSKSPVIPSPPPPSANLLFDGNFLSHYAQNDKVQHIEFGTVSQKLSSLSNQTFVTALLNNAEKNRQSPTNMKNSPQETERLKALFFGRGDSIPSSGNTTPGFNSPLNVPGKVKTLAELEGELQSVHQTSQSGPRMGRATPPTVVGQRRASPSPGPNEMAAFQKLISLMQAGAARPVESPKMKIEPRPPSPLVSYPHMLPQSALQHGLTQQQLHQQQQQLQLLEQLQSQQKHQQQVRLGAEMMFRSVEGGGGGQPMTNITGQPHPGMGGQDRLTESQAAQQQFLQAIQRNKEQQLQIRQATMHSMRFQQAPPLTHASQSQPQVPNTPLQSTNQQTPAQQIPVSVSGRRSSNSDPILNFLKSNPTIITKPASPTPPPHQPSGPPLTLAQHGSSPRGPSQSPSIPQALLSQQNPGSPRVPSPIMFSQQPPMHLSAPSPIHPSQSGGSLPQSPTTQGPNNSSNTIRPPSVPRVPSPQELVAHTQAILQKALIKKQLEDQKERFLKKQQERGKSPNPGVSKPGDLLAAIGTSSVATPQPLPPTSFITSTPIASKTPVNVAFTPTSVIRKLHSEKASEKEKQRRDSMDAECQDKQVTKQDSSDKSTCQDMPATPISQPHSMSTTPSSATKMDLTPNMSGSHTGNTPGSLPPTSIPPPSMIQAIPPPPLPSQVLGPSLLLPGGTAVLPPGLPSFNTNPLSHLPPPPTLTHVSTHIPPPSCLSPGSLAPTSHVSHHVPTSLVTQEQYEAAAKTQQFRALLAQQAPGQHGITLQAVSTTPSGRPIVKGIVVSSQSGVAVSTVMEMQRPLVGNVSSAPLSSVDIAKLLQHQHQHRQLSASGPMPPRTPTTPNQPFGVPLTGRIPVQGTPIIGPQAPTPVNNPLLVQQMLQGSGSRPMSISPLASLQAQRMFEARGVRPPISTGVMQRLSTGHTPNFNTPHSAQYNPRGITPQMANMKNGPISTSGHHIPISMVTNGNNNFTKADSTNLNKWFNTDMLKTQMPTMPPIPGQKVLTLDELERG